MRPLGLVDGKLIDLNENVIPMEDRGYQFGDGVYEVTRVYNGKCFALKRHMDRLYRSLREIRIPAKYTFEELAGFHQLLINETGIKEGGVYLQITRGVAPRIHNFPETVVPRLTMSLRPVTRNADNFEKGVKVMFIPDERWLRCDIKSINLLPNILGKQKAKEAGCYEAVMIRDGNVTEGTSSNFMVVKNGTLWTHPLGNLILGGVTRAIIHEILAPKLGIPIVEKPFSPEFAMTADEAFLSGTTTEVMPVVAIDGTPIGEGKPGPITRQLLAAYTALVDEECRS